MIAESAIQLNKELNVIDVDYELAKPQLVAKLKRYMRECFLWWVGIEPPLEVSDISAALITASAFFFVHFSCMLAN